MGRGREPPLRPPAASGAGRLAPRRDGREGCDDRERGQVMPLAAVGLFIMVLGVLATLNLGQAVHQKIKLQNTADAAAYTLAAMEARTFNYIAFLNRAQIAHYNTAMVIQSYITWVGFQIAIFGTAVDLLSALKSAVDVGAGWPCKGPGCPYIPLKAIITPLASIAEKLRDASLKLYDMGEEIGHKIVEAMSIFNYSTLWQSQAWRAALLNTHLLTGMKSYVQKHDKDIRYTGATGTLVNLLLNSALNSIEYYQAFDNASGINPFAYGLLRDFKRVTPPSGEYIKHSDEASRNAYRVMTEICHASRTSRFVSDRSGTGWGQAILAQVFGSKLGQTKLTESGSMSNAEIPPIGNEGNYQVGAYLSSDDFVRSVAGFASIGLANIIYKGNNSLGDAIAAYETKGKHYRYKGPSSTSMVRLSPDGSGVFAFPPVGGQAKTTETKNHAPWPGFAPYFKFKPKAERSRDYNQPSTWIILNKGHKDFQTDGESLSSGRAPWYAKFTWEQDGSKVALDTTIGGKRNSYLFEGLNVISRGMAYYHRPGNWTEHPNFFNPYWRAKLAPVGQKLQGFWDRWVTQKISTSGEDAAVQAAVNVLRGAQMDLFTAVVSSVITH